MSEEAMLEAIKKVDAGLRAISEASDGVIAPEKVRALAASLRRTADHLDEAAVLAEREAEQS